MEMASKFFLNMPSLNRLNSELAFLQQSGIGYNLWFHVK